MAEPVFEADNIEVYEQADRIVGKAEVGEDLCFVDRCEGFDGLYFDDNVLPDQDVRAKARIEMHGFINKRDWHFGTVRDSSLE